MSPFDFLNSINTSKKDLITDDTSEKQYSAFMVNRGLSYFPHHKNSSFILKHYKS